MAKGSFLIYLTGCARHIGISSIIQFFRNPALYTHDRDTASAEKSNNNDIAETTLHLDRFHRPFTVYKAIHYDAVTLPPANRRSSADRRAEADRRANLDRRKQSVFRWLGQRNAKYDRRSSRDQRSGIDRRKIDLLAEPPLQGVAAQNAIAFTVAPAKEPRRVAAMPEAVPSAVFLPIRDNRGRPVASVLKGQDAHHLRLNPEGMISQVDLYLDEADGQLNVQSMDSECLTLSDIGHAAHFIHVTSNGHTRLHVGPHSQGHICLHADRDSAKSVITVSVSGLDGDMEHYWGNTFRLGSLVLEIDQRRRVEIMNESGRRCRISGPAGPSNLRTFISGADSPAVFHAATANS